MSEESKEKGFPLSLSTLSNHPWLLLFFGIGGGSIGGGLFSQTLHPVLSPVVEAAILTHEEDLRAHNIDRLLERIEDLEEEFSSHEDRLENIEFEMRILNNTSEEPEE